MFLNREAVSDYYLTVKRVININTLDDLRARSFVAAKINCSLTKINFRKIFQKIHQRNIFIFGASSTLEDDIKGLRELLFKRKSKITIVGVNGATKALVDYGIYPDIVVTDLDGDFEALFKAAFNGAVMVIHAHGDNISALRKYLSKLSPYSIYTTQLEPEGCVENYGGFTDGDRALFLALKFGASKIFLIAMDFGDIVGKYSKPWLKCNIKAWGLKKKKFQIAKELIAKVAVNNVFTLGKSRIKNFNVKHLDYSEVENIIQ